MAEWVDSHWVYLDVSDLFVAWEVYLGHLYSSAAGARPEGWRPISVYLASNVRKRNFMRLQHELMMESVREQEFPQSVSRLTAMWYFPDRTTAERAPREWRFVPTSIVTDNLTEVAFDAFPKSNKHDSHWIDENMSRDEPFTFDDEDWIGDYWAGRPCPGHEPLWEILVEASGWVWGTDVRKRAYATIAQQQPTSLAILELAREAAELDSTLGHSAPFIREHEVGRFTLRYFMDFADATREEFLTRLHEYEGPRNLSDLNRIVLEEQGLVTPDFSDREFRFELSDFDLAAPLARLL